MNELMKKAIANLRASIYIIWNNKENRHGWINRKPFTLTAPYLDMHVLNAHIEYMY